MFHKLGKPLREIISLGCAGFGLAWVANVCFAADHTLSDAKQNMLRNAIETIRAEEALVGVQAAVFLKDKIAFSLSTGYADLEHKVSVTASTRFEVASITKPRP